MTDHLLTSLEIIAETSGDITDQVYAQYFADCEGSEALMDHMDLGVKGKMMQEVMRLLMVEDYAEEEGYLNFEVDCHQSSFSVEHRMYSNLFYAVRDVVKAGIGSQWTNAMDAAWQSRINALISEIDRRATPGKAISGSCS